ncbi:MAG: hypothetical protein KDB22_08905 [Planctomycetales bacterium]|nr:hypothetical protein [Planctomycetales bacterium]
MFPFRRRWPVLTGIGAAVLYVLNHYQIAGIEHLHIERLPTAGNSGNHPYADRPMNDDIFGHFASQLNSFDASQIGIQSQLLSSSRANPPGSGNPWDLSTSEKFAIIEDKLRRGLTIEAPGTSVPKWSMPVSKPIPAPDTIGDLLPDMPLPSTLPDLNALTRVRPAPAVPDLLASESHPALQPPPLTADGVASRTIRIAGFDVEALGSAKLSKPQIMTALVGILRQFDVIALQEIESSRDDILPRLVEALNHSGKSYDYLIGPRVGRDDRREQFAVIFDTNRVETDRYQLYTVDDPQDLMRYEPLVAWFRCKDAAADRAFTFSLINVHIDPENAERERELLHSLADLVAGDGRQEDDWIMLGNFSQGAEQLYALEREAIRIALRDVPTDVTGTQLMDTVLFSSLATVEYTGRAGAFDFLRKYNFGLEQALEVSSHLPVWAEFSVLEGGDPGRIAPLPSQEVF